MLSTVLTLRLDLPHTSPCNVSCVCTDFSFVQPRLPQARAIYRFVFLIELTGRQQQQQQQQAQRQQRNKETRLEKTNPDAAWRKKSGNQMNDDEWILREKSAVCWQRGEIELAAAAPGTLNHIKSGAEERRLPAGRRERLWLSALCEGKSTHNTFDQKSYYIAQYILKIFTSHWTRESKTGKKN